MIGGVNVILSISLLVYSINTLSEVNETDFSKLS